MAKFPVEYTDDEGVVDAVNYLLSGPSGLGQNFEGYSAYLPAYLRPASRQPWSLPIDSTLDPSVYLIIPINNITIVGSNPATLFTMTFTTPLINAPFQFGDRIDISDVVETGGDTSYNDTGYTVFSCTNTEVVVGYYSGGIWNSYNYPTYISGGNIGRDFLNYIIDTDCNAHVTVSGATQQVFVSAQINLEWEYNCTDTTTYNAKVRIGRLSGFPSATPGSNEYLFQDEVLITEKNNYFIVNPGSSTQRLEAIFTTVLDGPNLNFGYYWYILEVYFEVDDLAYPVYPVTIGKVTTTLRSLTAQVIKE